MEDRMRNLLKNYKLQTGQIFDGFGPTYSKLYHNASAPVMFDPFFSNDNGSAAVQKHDTGVGTENDVELWGAEGGLFADCCLDNPVMSLLARPMKAVGMLFPMVPNNNTVISRASLTGNFDVEGDRPDGVCEPGPNAGAFGNIVIEYRKGRLSMSTRTAELDALIENACQGTDPSRFYSIGGTRGVPGPSGIRQRDQTDEIYRSALYRELHAISNRMNWDLMRMFWTGDPANDTANGGYKEFRGLLNYIVDDYDDDGYAWVTNTNGDLVRLNSDVKTFGACVGGVNEDGYGLFQLLEEVEYEVTSRASMAGMSIDWVIVVPSIIARDITRQLPCEMLTGWCGAAVAEGAVQVNSNDAALIEARNMMQRSQMIALNGKNYSIVEDDFLPVVETLMLDGTTQYTSDLIFLPVRINGQPTIEWDYKDYRSFEAELGQVGSLADELRGWSDNGQFHSVLQRDLRCFILDTKIEIGLVFNASGFAGRITGLSACTIQPHITPNTLDTEVVVEEEEEGN
jgi:hypothetical protein